MVPISAGITKSLRVSLRIEMATSHDRPDLGAVSALSIKQMKRISCIDQDGICLVGIIFGF